MASSGNFATINFQAQSLKSTVTPTLGNLKFDGSTLNPSNYEGGVVCNFGMKSGKWYWETYLSGGGTSGSGRDWNVGFAPYSTASKSIDEGTYGLFLGNGSSSTLSGYGYTQYPSGTVGIRHNNSTSSFGSAHTSGDVLGHALDLDNGTWIIYKNGSSLGTAATGIDTSLTYFAVVAAQGGTISSFDITCNFGQDSTFGGALSAGGNADGNGFGDFKYSVPSGYLACSTANLPISDDIDPAQTDDDYPGKQFNAITYTGTGSTQSITGLNFQPDLLWLKCRSIGQSARLIDSSRGVSKTLTPADTQNEQTESNGITSFDSDGFTIGSATGGFNTGSATYVAWAWRANGGTTASNSEGSTTCTVQANTKGGFSMITYTGTGSAATLGHGLEKAPEFIMAKRRSSAAQSWKNYHVGLGATKYLTLNAADAAATSSGMWNDTAPSTTLISIGNESNVSTSSLDYIIYAWHSVEGYSKFGTYEGNANNDGTFVYTGFRPRMVFIKNSDGQSPWLVWDTARATFNPANNGLAWNDDAAESDYTGYPADILSNGFKLRSSNATINASGTWIYGAWGDVPFKYNNTF